MAVTINPGSAFIPTGTYPTSYSYQIAVDTSGGVNATISTANTSNPRIDVIVAYIDTSVTPTTSPVNNAGNLLKLAAVAGTPASSPSAPSGANIQSAIGAANPYIILAQVLVGANVTTVVNSNITDLRQMVRAGSLLGIATNTTSTVISGSSNQQIVALTVNVPSGVTTVELNAYIPNLNDGGASVGTFAIWKGSIGGTLLNNCTQKWQGSDQHNVIIKAYDQSPTSGPTTYYFSGAIASGANLEYNVAASTPATLEAKVI